MPILLRGLAFKLLIEFAQNGPKLAKIGQDWPKSAKIVQIASNGPFICLICREASNKVLGGLGTGVPGASNADDMLRGRRFKGAYVCRVGGT